MYYNYEEALTFIKDNDVKFIKLSFCDLSGQMRNISIMSAQFGEILESGLPIDALDIPGFDALSDTDLFLFPDPSTMVLLPWRPAQGRVARVLCDIKNAEGEPFVGDGRQLLRQAIEEGKKMGIRMDMGVEAEFYLFLLDENGQPTYKPMDYGTYLSPAPIDRGENIRREICLTLEEMGIQPHTSHHDGGPGQNEVTFQRSNPLRTADNLVMARNVTATIASKYGVWASFEPKPLPDEMGSGMHLFFSVLNAATLEPDFEKQKAFMAGILRSIKSLTAFLNPTIQSYLRLGHCRAPEKIGYSATHINELMRCQAFNPDKKMRSSTDTYFDLTSPDAGANPYLVLALLIRAGLAGIKEGLALDASLNIDSIRNNKEAYDRLESLPSTLNEAVAVAKADERLKSFIPSELLTVILDSISQ